MTRADAPADARARSRQSRTRGRMTRVRRARARRGVVALATVALAGVVARAQARISTRARGGWISTVDSNLSDCDACRAFMRAVEGKIADGKFQGELAAAIAEACEEATRGEASQMGVCVAAGEAGLRFATRYLENHPELGEKACEALEMCERVGPSEDAVVGMDAATAAAVRARVEGARGLAGEDACADCVMAAELMANELRSNSTINFVEGEVDALCAALGAELAHQCDAVLEPYVPALLDALADRVRNVCSKIGACPKLA